MRELGFTEDYREGVAAFLEKRTAELHRTMSAMKTMQLLNYERDRWVAGDGSLAEISSAIAARRSR